MCLGIPGKVIEIYETAGLTMGRIDFGGAIKEACLAYVDGVKVGDYVIIHVGFAISMLDEEEAHRTLQALHDMGDLDLNAELGPDLAEAPGGDR